MRYVSDLTPGKADCWGQFVLWHEYMKAQSVHAQRYISVLLVL